MTAVTDSLGALAIDIAAPGSGDRQAGDDPVDAVPPWFSERARIAADSLGLPSWSMAEGGRCAATGLALPPEAPPSGDPETRAACAEIPDGVFTLAPPRQLMGDRCPCESVCWEIQATAWLLRTKAGLSDNSLADLRVEIYRTSPSAPPVVRLVQVSWFMS